jgi:metal-responsive CopG/Arc/MetJ family transcriptional regulator
VSKIFNISICVDIPVPLKEQIDAYKEKTGIPQSAIIRKAVLRYLETEAPKTGEKQEQIAA